MRISRRTKAALATAAIVAGSTFLAALPAFAAIGPIVPKCATQQGVNPPDLNCVKETFLNIASLIIAISGSLALLMFVYGGFTMLSSGGEEKKISKGKTIIRNAVIGIFLIFLAGYIIDYGKLIITKGQVESSPDQIELPLACSDASLKSQGYVCMDPTLGKNCNIQAVCGSKTEQCCMPLSPDETQPTNTSQAPPDWLNNYMSNQ